MIVKQFDPEDFRNYMKKQQYKLSDKDQWIASRYGSILTYNEIFELRYIALKKVLIENNIEVITDLPWGKGLSLYKNEWTRMMDKAIESRKGKER